jgi:hypothetical protein
VGQKVFSSLVRYPAIQYCDLVSNLVRVAPRPAMQMAATTPLFTPPALIPAQKNWSCFGQLQAVDRLTQLVPSRTKRQPPKYFSACAKPSFAAEDGEPASASQDSKTVARVRTWGNVDETGACTYCKGAEIVVCPVCKFLNILFNAAHR